MICVLGIEKLVISGGRFVLPENLLESRIDFGDFDSEKWHAIVGIFRN